jgi:hypothetical protein
MAYEIIFKRCAKLESKKGSAVRLPDGLIIHVHPLCGQVPPHSRDLLIPVVVTSEYVALYRSLTQACSLAVLQGPIPYRRQC